MLWTEDDYSVDSMVFYFILYVIIYQKIENVPTINLACRAVPG
jgi:hypothetical protein